MKKILIVEDSEVSLKNIESALNKNFNLKIARNLKEARSKIGNNQFDLVLLDINLPDGNGFDFFVELATKGHGICPVVFISSDTKKEHILRGLELGQCDFIFKPFNPDELLARIETQIAVYERNLHSIGFEKELLTGEFGHEINNPLMSILNAFHSLKKTHEIANSKHALIIDRNLERLIGITKRYVTFYKENNKL